MAITSLSNLTDAASVSQDQLLVIPSATNVAGGWVALNLAVASSFGQLPNPGGISAIPSGTLYTQTSTGTGYIHWSPNIIDSGEYTYISGMKSTWVTPGTIHVYDLLWACTGCSATVTGSQPVSAWPGLPPRAITGAASGLGCEVWVHSLTPTGATASNITVLYLNEVATGGIRSTASTAMIASMPAYRMFQVPLQSGDYGISQPISVNLSGTTGTAGNFGIMILKRICSFSSPLPHLQQAVDFAQIGLPNVDDSAVLLFINQGTTTSTGIIMGRLTMVQG